MKLFLGIVMTIFGVVYVVILGAAAIGIIVGENYKVRNKEEE